MREVAPSAWIQFVILAVVLAGLGSIYVTGIGHHGMFMWDEAHYAVLGRALAQGEGYVDPAGRPEALRPPVVPFAVAAALRYLAGQNADRKALAVSPVAALLAVLVVYAATRADSSALGGVAAALLFGTFPEIMRLASYLLTELPLMVSYTAAVVLFHRGLHHDPRWFPVAWACFAVALLTRYTAVLFGPTCAVLVAICVARRDSAAMRRMRTPHFAIGPLVAGLLLLPMFARAYVYFGDPLVGFKLASQQLPDYSVHATMPALHYIWLLPQMIGWLPAVALAAAVGDVLARRDRLGLSCTAAATVIIAWLSQYGWKEPRLISAALPFFAIILGTSIGRLAHGEAFRDRRLQRSERPYIVAAAAAALFLVAVQLDPAYRRARTQVTHSVALGHPSFRWAMERLREETPATAVLMGANCYQMSWYAERPCLPLPSAAASGAAPRDFRDALSRADYLVATSFERGQPVYLHDQLAKLTPKDDSSGAVWRFRDPRFSTVVVPSALLMHRLAGDDR